MRKTNEKGIVFYSESMHAHIAQERLSSSPYVHSDAVFIE